MGRTLSRVHRHRHDRATLRRPGRYSCRRPRPGADRPNGQTRRDRRRRPVAVRQRNSVHNRPRTRHGRGPNRLRRVCDRALDLRAVDEDECHLAISVAAVGPRVAGGSLDEHIATLHQRLAFVHHRPDLAVKNDRVVEGWCGVEEEVAIVRRLVSLGNDRGEKLGHRLHVVFGVGREVDDPQDRSVRRRAPR